ncbi:hypothetical protein Cgig2_004643 [Carnegiea gigantea]|uniref:Uncharacterized protein n=1 Tax=Carnegiea gigantea TaxID=171969 RepID=A0A9Q1QE15_9CARY|nr:hypothetical protein Cgig2_004643 [Carnegiea gigantea]
MKTNQEPNSNMKDKIFQQQGKSTKGSEMEMGHQIMIPGETKGRGLAVVRQHRQEGSAVSVGGRRRITPSIARREWKRLASLHKERQDLLQTIDALQEGSDAPGIDGDNSKVTSSGVHAHKEDANIKAEKEELIRALDLNKELSCKLEVQTQRLELLTAQSMASENTIARELTGFLSVRESVAHADEGDEAWYSDAVIGDPAGGGESFRIDNEAVSSWTLKTTAQQTLS